MAVYNFVHRDGTIYEWEIGGAELKRRAMASDYVYNIEMGLYLGLFLIFMLLYWMQASYRASLYFALACLTWFLRAGVIGNKVFTVLLPWLNWYAKFRLEYLSIPVGVVLMILIVRSLFPGVLHKAAVRITLTVSGVLSLLFLCIDTFSMSQLKPLCQVIYITFLLYMMVRFGMKLRHIRLEQGLLLAGLAQFFYAAVRDAYYYNNTPILPPFTNREISHIALLVLMLFEAAAVFLGTMREVAAAKEAEQRLIAENAALDKINELKSEWMQTISRPCLYWPVMRGWY